MALSKLVDFFKEHKQYIIGGATSALTATMLNHIMNKELRERAQRPKIIIVNTPKIKNLKKIKGNKI